MQKVLRQVLRYNWISQQSRYTYHVQKLKQGM